MKGKISAVCDARCLVRRRQVGVSGGTEESLFIILSFDVVFAQQSDVRIYKVSCMIFYADYITLLQVPSLWACGSSV